MDAMVQIILEDKEPEVPVDGEEAVKDLKIIDTSYLDVKSGKKNRHKIDWVIRKI